MHDFILGRLPREKDDIFFDASTTLEIGTLYFAIPWGETNEFFVSDVIARKGAFSRFSGPVVFFPGHCR